MNLTISIVKCVKVFPDTYLYISGVSLEDRQTQHQKEELLSETALHNAHLCLEGEPERRKSELLCDQLRFL